MKLECKGWEFLAIVIEMTCHVCPCVGVCWKNNICKEDFSTPKLSEKIRLTCDGFNDRARGRLYRRAILCERMEEIGD